MRIMTIVANNENIKKIKHGFEVNNLHPRVLEQTIMVLPILDYQLCLAKGIIKQYVSDFHENESFDKIDNLFEANDQVKVFLSQEEMALYK